MTNAAELLRLIHNMIRLGTIAEVDHAAARVRVTIGALCTDWLPWQAPRAGATRDWDPPTVGEQVVVLAAGGELTTAIVLTGLFSTGNPAPGDTPDNCRRIYPDGAVIDYNHKTHHLEAIIPGSAKLNATAAVDVTAGGSISLDSGADINITAAGNVLIDGARVDIAP